VLFTKPVNHTSVFPSTPIENTLLQFFTAIGGSITANFYDDTKDSLGNVLAP